MSLMSSETFGDVKVKNRIFMAPLTRMRADNDGVPGELAAEYYTQRASAGLIITEASQISEHGKGYPATPGIYSDEQRDAWQKITDSVHAAGGVIFFAVVACGTYFARITSPQRRITRRPIRDQAQRQGLHRDMGFGRL